MAVGRSRDGEGQGRGGRHKMVVAVATGVAPSVASESVVVVDSVPGAVPDATATEASIVPSRCRPGRGWWPSTCR